MKEITSKIINYSVVNKEANELQPVLLTRDDNLSGTTYKIKPSNEDHAYYITINNKIVDGKVYPFELFINSKNVKHFQWIAALTRLISAIFRHGTSIDFLIKELVDISDPNSGYWGKDKLTNNGKYYNSLVQEIGEVIKLHVGQLEELNK